jgi:hypothetical protein
MYETILHFLYNFQQGYFVTTNWNAVPEVLSQKDASWNSVPEPFFWHQYN